MFAAWRAAEGASKARLLNDIIAGEETLIGYCAKKLAKGDMPDLMQAGRIGVMKALRKFDPTRGQSFSRLWKVYAQQWILDEMKRGVVYGRPLVQTPATWRPMPKPMRRLQQEIQSRTGAPATAAELGTTEEKLEGWTSRPIVEHRCWTMGAESDRARGSNSAEMGQIQIAEALNLQDGVLTKTVLRALGTLSTLEHKILLARVVEERTCLEIAEELGLQDEWVRKACLAALAKVRAALGVEGKI